jgi:primosomal protein N' (replication factor Y)
VDRDPLAGLVVAPAAPVELTPGQAVIAREIRRILEDAERHPRTFLVQGVTGSGKTEIYLDATEKCLALGKRAIVLVPEIALTHQTIERFAARFPGQVAVQHSGLSDGERHDQWWRIKQGDYGIVIGSRGAVFAPQPDLGLIVLDEEHEWTYKQQDASPRYHARSVAERLSEMTGAVVLMGSASPDVGTYYRGLLKDINLFLLADRFAVGSDRNGERKGSLARVHLVDMREELKSGNREMFSRKLFFELEQCIASGDQAVLFINRRGSASSLQCRNCGFTVRCRRCDITMTLHRQPDRLLCHYCGDRRAIIEQCPRCLTFRMSFYGFGTETVLGELQRHFSDASAIRWDRDTVRTAKDYETALNRFRSGEAQVLVGTQMIAKGLHFPNVTLVGVVSADVGLHIPDFSAAERTFQIVCQVAGRSGRGERPGTVVVQTYQPENYAVQSAAAQDYQAFYRREMAFRRRQADPPYSKLIRLLYAHRNAAQCEGDAIRLSDSLREQRDAWGMSDVDLLGPVPAFPARLRGMYRWQIVLRGPEPRLLLDKASVPTGWQVDMDPVSLS